MTSFYHAHQKAQAMMYLPVSIPLWMLNFYHLSVKMEDRSSNRYLSLSSITNGEKNPKIKA